MSNLKVELRHYQTVTDTGQPYRWTGNSPNTLVKQVGDPIGLVEVREYFDVTEKVLNLDSLDFTWQVGDNDQHLKQVISEEISFFGDAAKFIRDWIVNRAYSPLNLVEVRFTDLVANKVIGEFLIKPQKISYCINDDCAVSVTVVSNDLFYDCISKTKINDNHDGFMSRGYRAYDYCVEKRPAVLTAIMLSLGSLMLVFGIALAPVTTIINAIGRLAGASFNLPTWNDFLQAFYQLVGYGRVHAAASAREYTDNVCLKCGVTVDTAHNFLYKETIEHRGHTINNPFFWLDILFAQTAKGKKNNDPNRFKLSDLNIPIIALSDLYNDLAKVFNAKWYITGDGKLRFLLRQEFANSTPVLFFDSFEQRRIIKLCHDVTDKQQPLTAEYGYQQDSIDLCANDGLLRYNSKASFDADGSVNPNLKGHQDYTVPFGTTRFRDDNITKDYADEATGDPIVFIGALAVIMIAALFLITSIGLTITGLGAANGIILGVLSGFLVAEAILYIAGTAIVDLSFVDAIVMSQDVCNLPKLLIRSQKTEGQQDDARAENGGTGASKIPNTLFNPLSKTYDQIHDYNEETPVQNLRNYPLFFDTRFQNNVFDICWSKNDFRLNAVTQRETTVEFVACEDDLNALGVYQNQNIAIDERFQFPQELAGDANYVTNKARIENIKVNFMTRKVTLIGTNFN